jgi:geranylgeranyl pyrophosphate synthase
VGNTNGIGPAKVDTEFSAATGARSGGASGGVAAEQELIGGEGAHETSITTEGARQLGDEAEAASNADFSQEINKLRSEWELYAESSLRNLPLSPEIREPIEFAFLAPGKRFRPLLVLGSGAMLGQVNRDLFEIAFSAELLHAASLVHDDLPILDNDSLRRGLPTCHVKFGAGKALLAADAMIALAFQVLSNIERRHRAAELVTLFSGAFSSLCLGQILDLQASGNDPDDLRRRHLNKTAALIAASVAAPAVYLGDDASFTQLLHYGEKLGLLFQITDDLIDATVPEAELGKDAASDIRRGTPTYVSVYGEEKALEIASEVEQQSLELLAAFGGRAGLLRSLTLSLKNRRR